ncbi:hypothetical protein EDM80_13195 [bacterium]|nr:MAG: hypothetical protein EDM80_13195 [bacterium]RIK59690.1 MAG: hypothetical protein DCC64_15635 [Planctomycetota bacterium]
MSETIEHWTSEFLASTPGELAAQRVGERTGALLVKFLEGACGSALDPADMERRNITDGIAIGLAPLQLSDVERNALPELLEEFLTELEHSGRLSGGAQLGAYARQTATAHLLKKQVRRATAKVGPNEPCPCGSGKKYKKCCM